MMCNLMRLNNLRPAAAVISESCQERDDQHRAYMYIIMFYRGQRTKWRPKAIIGVWWPTRLGKCRL